MTKKRQILVIGNNTNGCTPKHEKLAYEIGVEIAKSNSVLITGGLGGVMAAASHGAHDTNGLTVGIIPQDDAIMANEFCDIVIPTGMGLARDFLNALTADGVIIVGGGSGTLSEVCAAYMYKKPMVAIRNIKSSIEPYIDGFLDHRENIKIVGVDTPSDAVKKILKLIAKSYKSDTESTDAEIIDDFNKTKSGEVSRMAQKSSG
ncbi:TIGR00725 family protein [Marine Group I thaumarchaeote]|uniref:TIGR00725 family protein n=2 Tax=Marine Group I thaumarchaeote TaxID=2511932 RepID=A0A7K4MU16_9ARCH|nr:TIGR00725 family protein [Marine Group I thaumarchaeote]NWK13709.1 TIGR00725 family protein [Marine Group I thaumarchaeote]